MSNQEHARQLKQPSTTSASGPGNERIEIDLEAFAARVRLLWNKRRFLGRAWLAAIVVAVLFGLLAPKLYLSTAVLAPPSYNSPTLAMLNGLSGGAGGGGGVAGAVGAAAGQAMGAVSDLLGVKDAGEMYVRALQTEKVEDRLINRFDLRRAYGAALMTRARTKLEHRSDISEDKKSGMILISVKDYNPRRAADLANAYADELDALLMDVNVVAATRERKFYEEQLKQAKAQLDDAVSELARFASNNTVIEPDDQEKAMMEAAAALQSQLVAAQAQLRSVQQVYTDNNRVVAMARGTVDEVNKELQKLVKEGADPNGKNPSEDLYPSIRKLPLVGGAYADLYRRMKIREAVYELLVQQYEMNKLQEIHDLPSVQVMDPAVSPELPELLLPVALSVLLGLLIGGAATGWVLLADWWKRLDARDPRRILLGPAVAAMAARSARLRQRFHPAAPEPLAELSPETTGNPPKSRQPWEPSETDFSKLEPALLAAKAPERRLPV